ncbi:MAG: YdcF family protein [Bacteroidota bacterium]
MKNILLSGGSLFLVLCLLAFTSLPFWAYYRLATSEGEITEAPEIIVMLAGAGIPSENGLIRAYYTARLAQECPDAIIFIAVPGKLSDSLGDPSQISAELVFRGVNPEKVYFANIGKNTRGQAQEISKKVQPNQLSRPLTIVTSPEHMKRAVMSFRKCGFTNVSGFPAFESSLTSDLTFNDQDLEGNELAPPIGKNLQVRYQFWNHLKYEVIVIREYFALTYYKIRGWI